MKKIKLLAAVAAAGLFVLTANAASTGYENVTVKATLTFQATNTGSGSITKYNVTKVKVTNKELLNQIATNFNQTFPAGAKLVVDSFWNGNFSVLAKDGSVLLANASSSTNSFELYTDYDNYIYTGSDNSDNSTYTENYTAIGYLYFQNGDDSFDFEIYGATSLKDSVDKNGNYNQSFKLSGADDAYDGSLGSNSDGVASGKVSGSGKNLD